MLRAPAPGFKLVKRAVIAGDKGEAEFSGRTKCSNGAFGSTCGETMRFGYFSVLWFGKGHLVR